MSQRFTVRWQPNIVYALRNTRNNKVYIGSTRQFRRRAAVHISQLNSGSHPNTVLQQEWQEYGPQAFTWELVTHGYHREEQEAISELFSTTPELLYNQDFKPPKEQPGLQDESSNGGDVVIENPLLRRGFTQIPNAILTGATDFGERKVGLRYVAELCMARMTWD